MYLQFKRAFMALCLFMTCMIAFAQRQVTGSVTDALGKPLIGVSVTVDGTTIGTITDVNGNFTLSRVPEGASLKISYIGYLEQILKLGTQSNYYVTLHEDNQNLDELVVIGYQSVKKRDITGAVSSIKEEDMLGVANADPLVAMQGKVAGMNLTQSSGEAGSTASISIRSANGFAANNPLYIVDGVDYGEKLDFNASEIESIDILKDASSTAIYGTRGANGVVIITTKRGSAGKTHISLSAYNSWNSVTQASKPLYGDDEVKWRQEKASYATNYNTYKNTGEWGTYLITPEDMIGNLALTDGSSVVDIYNNKSYTDWRDYIIRDNTSQNYELNINGGSERTTFNVSLGFLNDRGLMNRDGLKRYNGKISIDHKVNDIMKVGGSFLYAYEDRDRRNTGVYNQYLKMSTITKAYFEDGSVNSTPNPWYPAHSSPILDDIDGRYQDNTTRNHFFGNAYAEFNIIKNLNYRTQLSVDYNTYMRGRYIDYLSTSRYQSPANTYISQEHYNNTKYTWNNTIKYSTDFNATKHNLDILVGHEMISNVNEIATVYGTCTDHYYKSAWRNLDKIDTKQTDNTYVKYTMLSFFGRLNYSYADKYIFTASLRSDGASRLAKGHKWETFPSFAAAWRITEEPWMISTISWLNNLKLRASWGISGNVYSVDPYDSEASLSDKSYSYYMGGEDVSGKVPKSSENPRLTWQKTSSFDIGLDFGFFNGRLNGSIDFYWGRTNDILAVSKAPASSVYTDMISNVGSAKNNGFEATINADIISKRDFNWNLALTYAHYGNKITKLTKGATYQQDSDTKYFVLGKQINTYYDYKADNTWAVGEYETYLEAYKQRHNGESPNYGANYGDPGTPKIVDVNDDGYINADDRVTYNMDPSAVYGITNTFSYKGITLSVVMSASTGAYCMYKLGNALTFEDANWADVDYWTVDNQHAKFPSPGLTTKQQTWFTTYRTALLYEKAEWFKIKDITLSYDLPSKWLSGIHMEKINVYGSLKNFFTFSSIDNYDPERGGAVTFPLKKQVVLGIKLTF